MDRREMMKRFRDHMTSYHPLDKNSRVGVFVTADDQSSLADGGASTQGRKRDASASTNSAPVPKRPKQREMMKRFRDHMTGYHPLDKKSRAGVFVTADDQSILAVGGASTQSRKRTPLLLLIARQSQNVQNDKKLCRGNYKPAIDSFHEVNDSWKYVKATASRKLTAVTKSMTRGNASIKTFIERICTQIQI